MASTTRSRSPACSRTRTTRPRRPKTLRRLAPRRASELGVSDVARLGGAVRPRRAAAAPPPVLAADATGVRPPPRRLPPPRGSGVGKAGDARPVGARALQQEADDAGGAA